MTDPQQHADRKQPTLEELWTQYRRGEYDAVLEQTAQHLGSQPAPETLPDLHALRAWCCYRQENYPGSMSAAEAAGEDNLQAVACKAYLFAHTTPFRDEELLLKVLELLPANNFDALNALCVSARQEDTTINPQQVWERSDRFIAALNPQLATVPEANLINNLARLAQSQGDLAHAADLMTTAIDCYGTESNFHHRAAANYHLSIILQGAGQMFDAWSAAEQSLLMWDQQRSVEPSEKNEKRYTGATEHERRLRETRFD